MSTADLEKINKIFNAALDVDRGERTAFLAKACGDDSDLLAEVEALIAARDEADEFFDKPAWRTLEQLAARQKADVKALEVEDGLPFERLGEFRLIRQLGGGGMGIVYLAEQESLGRLVAVKVIHQERSGSIDASKRFWREIDALSRLRHRHIVTVFESGEHNGVHYFAMELVPGNDLDMELAGAELGDERIKVPEILVWIRDIARALSCAHQAGIIHRDVKPSNIRISSEGEAILMDFGVARHLNLSAMTQTGEFRGTPYYASPEQVKAKPQEIDARTDIYSLGVVLYEALTGRIPFSGETTEQVFRQILHKNPVPPRRLNGRISRDAEIVISAAMEKEPSRRYKTMAEFADDLQHLLNGEMIKARPAGMATKTWRRVKRYPVASLSLAVASAALLVITVVFPWIIATKEKERREETERANREINEQREKLARQASLAENLVNQILRLSDLKSLFDLKKKAKNLWPAHPEVIPDLEAWLRGAEKLRGRLDNHRDILETLREDALPYGIEAQKRDIQMRRSHPEWNRLQDLIRYRARLAARLSGGGATTGAPGPEVASRFATIDDRIAGLRARVAPRRVWEFDDAGKQWWHDTLTELVTELEKFFDDEIGSVTDIEKRLAFASSVKADTIDKHRDDWNGAIRSIADREECPFYDGLLIEPLLGFVPIGRDPDSGLWEFAHVQTGTIPRRGAEGRLVLTDDSCLVFVLIPGGSFEMGAMKPSLIDWAASTRRDPHAKLRERPIHDVTVKPFLMSKYEMTQGQGLHFTGSHYGYFGPACRFAGKQHTLRHPVEMVSWLECAGVLSHLGLRLPTEAEWEYAARAGTTTVWWTGNEIESLAGAANVSDRTLKELEELMGVVHDEMLDDRYAAHAPVGSFRPNPFGLHDTSGNVCEWCQDKYHENYVDAPVDGTAREAWGRNDRVFRGGSWFQNAEQCRSAARAKGSTNLRSNYLGVRPACSLE